MRIFFILRQAFGKTTEVQAIVREHIRGTEGRDGFRLIDHLHDQQSGTVGLVVQDGKAQCFSVSVCVPEGYDKNTASLKLKEAIDWYKDSFHERNRNGRNQRIFNGIDAELHTKLEEIIDPPPVDKPTEDSSLTPSQQPQIPNHVQGVFKAFFANPEMRDEIRSKISKIANEDGTIQKERLLNLIMEMFSISYLETGPVFRSLVSDKDGVPILDMYNDPSTDGKSYRLHQDKIFSTKPEDHVSEEKHTTSNQQSPTSDLNNPVKMHDVSSESLSCHLQIVADFLKSFKSPTEYKAMENRLKEALAEIATLKNEVAELQKKLTEMPRDDHDRALRAEEALQKIKQALNS